MATFMCPKTFDQLKEIRKGLLKEGLKPAGIFVPWAGEALAREGKNGLYYVGMASDGEYGANDDQTFDACLQRAAEMCDGKPHGRSHTFFWKYLDALTGKLFGGLYYETVAKWGWSNVFKIGSVSDAPNQWSEGNRERQREACALALKEEFSKLKQSLIVIAYNDDIVKAMLGGVWHKEQEDAGIYWRQDDQSGNVFVWSYHPKSARLQKGLWDKQIKATIEVARQKLPWVPRFD